MIEDSNLLQVMDLSVQFDTYHGRVEAIDEANLTIKKGEVIGLVGESGCGKTTMARAVLNVVPSPPGKISQGKILFQGKNLLLMEEKELNSSIRGKAITLIPQDPLGSFNPLFSIGTQLLDIAGRKFERPPDSQKSKDHQREIEHKIVHMLSRVQLPSPESILRRYPHELSGGQRQRIMIAMALLTDPLLVIADEPTTFLDVTVQAQILQILKRLVREQRVSVLYITHNLAVASHISDQIVVMYAGQIMELAPTRSFFANPVHPYARKLLECLPNVASQIKGIPGSIPSLVNPPKGCRFVTRCDRAQDPCHQKRPLLEEIESGHWIYCYNPLIKS
jgi:oligopeptide/dipeptide ABC transporter ATP-binding protein